MGETTCTPGYLRLLESGELEERGDRLWRVLEDCTLCPRQCRVDRTAGEVGYCGAGADAKVYSYMPHPGEEPPISGSRGSGTIFFSHCTLSCVYCQNCTFSQIGRGKAVDVTDLAGMMLELASDGCHNINLVSPTHFAPQIVKALALAAREGMSIPLVWNTSSYETRSLLRVLDGVVDVYLADLRYSSPERASEYSDAPDYPEVCRGALLEMRRQVGALTLDSEGNALRGLVVRHLVLPEDVSGTGRAMEWIAGRLGIDTYVSLMSQYYPAYEAVGDPVLGRRITREEWQRAVESLENAGLDNGWVQGFPDGLSPVAGTRLEPRR
ncbi:MAG: radical SAM protein [Candidatus Eisenbacteria bacterium]|nr:radical SAM protein [Candidatus Eisenbacteria bacterium]